MRSSTLSCVLRLNVISVLCVLSVLRLGAIDANSLPKPTGYVSDLAHVVNPGQKEQLEEFSARVEQELGVQFAFVTIDTLDDQPIRDFSLDVFRKWGVGDRKTNQGVLLLLAIKDHKSDIETGRGIEPYLTDGFSGSTLRSMRPELRSGDYGAALLSAAHTMATQIAQGKGISFADNAPVQEQRREVRQRHDDGLPFPLIIFGIFFLVWLLGRGGGRYGGGGGGFWTGILLGNLLSGRRDYRGGGWGDGGGFGGGSGGGGFGGFGGGDAGGGGASSNW